MRFDTIREQREREREREISLTDIFFYIFDGHQPKKDKLIFI